MATLERPNLTVRAKGTLPSVPFARIKDAVLGARYELSVSFVSPGTARRLNKAHRGKDYVPDTLAFSFSSRSGEIVMCRFAMRKSAAAHAMTPARFAVFLFIHSCLHLKGYAHGATMERKERKLLEFFSPLKPSTSHEAQHRRRH